MEWLCSQDVSRRNEGRLQEVAKTTPIDVGCGRPAKWAVRGFTERPNGSIYFYPWSARCETHYDPKWEAWALRQYPKLIGHHVTARLEV